MMWKSGLSTRLRLYVLRSILIFLMYFVEHVTLLALKAHDALWNSKRTYEKNMRSRVTYTSLVLHLTNETELSVLMPRTPLFNPSSFYRTLESVKRTAIESSKTLILTCR